MFCGAVIANFESLDSHVTLVMNGEHTASALGNQMPGVQDGDFTRITSKSDVSVARVAGGVDAYALLVDSTAHVDSTACTRRICRMLNRTPGCRLSARIRIVPSR